jgi:ABC-type Na+ efflux pump permease subunit
LLGPIFAREWITVPRRARHYVIRAAYLGLLWVLGLTAWQALVGWSQTATLGETARFGRVLFHVYALVQLVLVTFFAALSAASAVAQEKDRRTFVLLLITDLRNHEIVLGKLLGSLLQIALLLVGMVPVLAMILLLGGVSASQIVQTALVLAATALAAGSLGSLIALWREKTFQALALTVLFLVLYVCSVRALALAPSLAERLGWSRTVLGQATVETWQQCLDPLLALQTVLDPTLVHGTFLVPAVGFAVIMIVFSVLLNAWGIVRLRAWNPSGERIQQREVPEEEEDKNRARAHAAPGPVRRVWSNPILWREIRTRAYGRRMALVKAAYFLVFGLVCYYAFAPLAGSAGRSTFAAAYGLVPVGVLSLLLVTAQAVTAITSERDAGALDLLLVTDLTPHEFVFGKLGGIVYNTKEFLLPPIALTIFYASRRLLATPATAGRNAEAAFCVGIALVVLLAFAVMLGIHVALRTENSRLAIVNGLGTVFFLSVATLICIGLIGINRERFAYQWTSFILFIASGIGGLWWVLNGDRPSAALTVASWACPLAMFYSVMNIIIAKPGSEDSTDPLIPFIVTAGAFGFSVAAMLVPLLSEFDVALGRTTGGGE